jgi:hypothetical protein
MTPQGLMLSGLGLAALGGIITGVTYAAASGGGTYVITWGLIAVGGWNFLRGFYHWVRQQGRY